MARRHELYLWVDRDETAGRSPLPAATVARDQAHLASVGVRLLSGRFRALREALATTTFDIALFEFHQMAARYAGFVRAMQPSCRVIVDSVDLHFARLDSAVRLGIGSHRHVARTRALELSVYRAADAVVATSELDARQLACEPDVGPVWVVPLVVHVRPRSAAPRNREALFVGHFNHAPNRDGLRWFVETVWPAVRASYPDARLTVIGTHAPEDIRALGTVPGVEVLGYVPHLEPYLDRTALVVTPLRYGAGMKGKVTDAMAAGVPVVTTSVGAQGLGLISGTHALVADQPEAFAARVCDLFGDPVRRVGLGQAGQRHIATLCAPEQVDAELVRLVDKTCHADVDAGRTGLLATVCRWWQGWYLMVRHAVLASLRRQVPVDTPPAR